MNLIRKYQSYDNFRMRKKSLKEFLALRDDKMIIVSSFHAFGNNKIHVFYANHLAILEHAKF